MVTISLFTNGFLVWIIGTTIILSYYFPCETSICFWIRTSVVITICLGVSGFLIFCILDRVGSCLDKSIHYLTGPLVSLLCLITIIEDNDRWMLETTSRDVSYFWLLLLAGLALFKYILVKLKHHFKCCGAIVYTVFSDLELEDVE